MKKIMLLLIVFSNAVQAGIVSIGAPGVPTKAEAKLIAKSRIKERASNVFMQIKMALNFQYEVVWSNRNGLTPQEVFTALDGDQCDARHKFLSMSAFVNSIQPGAVLAEPKPIVESGSGESCVVTVGE